MCALSVPKSGTEGTFWADNVLIVPSGGTEGTLMCICFRSEQNADSQKNFCKNQKSCIFASLELAEPLNNA